jgi:predicted anti-sigma-YlaC factor YlaD
MNSDCERIRDRITDHISGILPETETEMFEEHLMECSMCRGYAQKLGEEERLLTQFFAQFDMGISSREDAAISVINRIDTSGRRNILSVGNRIAGNLFLRRAAAAVLIVFVTVYFVLTLTWISEINEIIRLSL